MTVSGSGTASMSGCAGVMSSQVAKPAKPAPSSCISAMACAGTSLARCPPKRSVNEIMKYLMPISWAKAARSVIWSFPVIERKAGKPPRPWRFRIRVFRGTSWCLPAAPGPWRRPPSSAHIDPRVRDCAHGFCRRRAPASGIQASEH